MTKYERWVEFERARLEIGYWSELSVFSEGLQNGFREILRATVAASKKMHKEATGRR
jgi:hypothetical protein